MPEQVKEHNGIKPAGERHEKMLILQAERNQILAEAVLERCRVYLPCPPLRRVSSERTPRTPSTSQASSVA